MSNPLVSVIIPYYNAGTFIEQALASVRRQNYAPLQIVLIDDGSTDDIAQRVKAWGDDIVFLRQENKGPAAARNRGIRHASGDIIAFIDADDCWPDGKLASQVARLVRDPSLGMVTGRVQWVALEGADERALVHPELEAKTNVHLGAALVRRAVFDRLGLFDEELRFHEDQDWFMRIRESDVKLAIMDEVTLIYHMHGNNMTHRLDLYKTGFFRMLKRSLDRRKSQSGIASDLPPLSRYRDLE